MKETYDSYHFLTKEQFVMSSQRWDKLERKLIGMLRDVMKELREEEMPNLGNMELEGTNWVMKRILTMIDNKDIEMEAEEWGKAGVMAGVLGSYLRGYEPDPLLEAIKFMERGLKMEKTAVRFINFGMVYREFDDERREEMVRKAVKFFPESGFAWRELGDLLSGKGEERAKAYRKAVELEPEEVKNWNNLLRIVDKGELDEREKIFKKIIELERTDRNWSRFISYLELMGDEKEVEKMFQEGVKIFPKSVKLWYEWGQKYLRKGELEKAKKNLEKVLELCSGRFNTNPSEVMVDLGNINIKQGKEEEARELYLEALWLTPETHLRLEREGLLTEEELKDLDKNRKKRTTQEYYQKTGRRYIEEEKQREKAIEINKNDY